MAHLPPLPRHRITTWQTHNTEKDINFAIHIETGWVIYADIDPSYFLNSPLLLQEYHHCLEALRDNSEEMDGAEALEWLTRPFEQVVEELTHYPSPLRPGTDPTLSDYLYAPHVVCQLRAVNEHLQPLRMTSPPQLRTTTPTAIRVEFLTQPRRWTKAFHPDDVRIPSQQWDPTVASLDKVLVTNKDGTTTACHFKKLGYWCQPREENPELTVLKNLALARKTAQNGHFIRSLYGLVRDKSQPGYVGMLFNWIDSKGMMSEDLVETAAPPVREKWATQIQDSVRKLHQLGLVWGNPGWNCVLIDQDDNAWIKFGNGFLLDWIDDSKRGTVEGDLQGVEKLLRMLKMGDS